MIKTEFLIGEEFLAAYGGSKIDAHTAKEWIFNRAETVGEWILTDKRLVFEEQKINMLHTLGIKKSSENFKLTDITGIEIVPWAKREEVLKINFREGEPALLRLQYYKRKKLQDIKQQIEQVQKEREGKKHSAWKVKASALNSIHQYRS